MFRNEILRDPSSQDAPFLIGVDYRNAYPGQNGPDPEYCSQMIRLYANCTRKHVQVERSGLQKTIMYKDQKLW